MEDNAIIELYWQRNERAIAETKNKYARLILHTAGGILGSPQDREEIENDTYLRVWNSVPNDRPARFSAYLVKIARRLSIDRFRGQSAEKRGGTEYEIALDELESCTTDGDNPADEAQANQLSAAIDIFLEQLEQRTRQIFVLRYFYAETIRTIAEKTGKTENNVKVILSRTRKRLKEYLEQEGF